MISAGSSRWLAWLSMIRVHQWTKNFLIFVPLLTAFRIGDPDSVRKSVLAFFAFSLLASATYIVNDLKDLESDRAHPRKRSRAIASGAISIPASIAAAAFLGACSVILGWYAGPLFLGMMGIYLVLTTAYSLLLKSYFLLDVILLALLYGWRILAGSVVIEVATSEWLLAFSSFLFLGDPVSLIVLVRFTALGIS